MAEKISTTPLIARIYQLCSTEPGRRAFISYLGERGHWSKPLEHLSDTELSGIVHGIERHRGQAG